MFSHTLNKFRPDNFRENLVFGVNSKEICDIFKQCVADKTRSKLWSTDKKKYYGPMSPGLNFIVSRGNCG